MVVLLVEVKGGYQRDGVEGEQEHRSLAYLGHVAWRVRVLGSEDGPDAVHALPPAGDLELLVELGALSQEGLLLEVGQAEDVGTALGGGADQARRLELHEALALEIVGEQLAGPHAHVGDGLLDGGALVHDGVAEVSAHAGARGGVGRDGRGLDGSAGLLDLLIASVLLLLLVVEVVDGAVRGGERHAEDGGAGGDAVALG